LERIGSCIVGETEGVEVGEGQECFERVLRENGREVLFIMAQMGRSFIPYFPRAFLFILPLSFLIFPLSDFLPAQLV